MNKTIDMTYNISSPGLYARLTWQQMFDWYRENGGSLADMDSMLCDYQALIRFFETGAFEIYFYFSGEATYLSHDPAFSGECLMITYDSDNEIKMVTHEVQSEATIEDHYHLNEVSEEVT